MGFGLMLRLDLVGAKRHNDKIIMAPDARLSISILGVVYTVESFSVADNADGCLGRRSEICFNVKLFSLQNNDKVHWMQNLF